MIYLLIFAWVFRKKYLVYSRKWIIVQRMMEAKECLWLNDSQTEIQSILFYICYGTCLVIKSYTWLTRFNLRTFNWENHNLSSQLCLRGSYSWILLPNLVTVILALNFPSIWYYGCLSNRFSLMTITTLKRV